LPFVVIALVASWLGFFLITPLPFLALETFSATVRFHLATGLIFIPYLVSLIVTRRLPGGSALDLPLMALLGVYLLTTATSLDWRVSLEVTLTALAAIGVFYVLSDARLLRRSQVETALMLAVLAAALRALWVVGGDYLDWLRLVNAVQGGISLGDLLPPTVPKLHDVGDHPNLLGGILAMSLPFFLVGALRTKVRLLRVLVAVGAGAVLLAVFLSLARSAWLAAAAGGLTTMLLLFVGTSGGSALLKRLWPSSSQRQTQVGLIALLLAGVLLLVAFVVQSAEARPLWLFRPSATPRWDVMEAGGEIFADNVLLGTGPGVFSLLYPEYSGKYPNHAFHVHNGFLQAATDMGVPGVLAMLLLTGAVGWLVVRGLRETDGAARLSIAACAGALVAFGTFSLFDAPNGFKGPLVALAAVGAVAVLSYREGVTQEDGRPALLGDRWLAGLQVARLSARVFVPIAMVGLLITWGRVDIGHYFYSSGLTSANVQNWSRAIEQGQRAVDLDPQYAIYRLELGAIEGQAYLDIRDRALLDDAIGQLQRGLELEPRSAIGHANLALLLADAGERAAARTEALAALRFANSDSAVVLAAATALEASNWGEDAVRAYSQALFLDAGLADSPFWQESPFRSERFPDILGGSALIFNPCALLGLSTRGAPLGELSRDDVLTRCRARVERDPGGAAGRVSLAEALIQGGAFGESFVLLDGVLAREPDRGEARTALGRWHAAQGEVEEARQQWLLASQLDQVEALVLLGDSYAANEVPARVVELLRSELEQSASQVQLHLTGILYFRFKFFRESPAVILLPGEWQRAVPARYALAQDALERWTRASSGR
jgi:tetratricopeptide (TPR) repeat protein